jgi:hypothetical protein
MSISQHLYNQVMMADDFTCVYCGLRTADITVDHFVPQSFGGPDVLHNLFACCQPCNSRKCDRPAHLAGMRLIYGRFGAQAQTFPTTVWHLPDWLERMIGKPAPEYSTDEELIGVLAMQERKDGTPRFTDQEIIRILAKQIDAGTVLAIVRQVREPAPEFRPLTDEQRQLRQQLQLDQP